MAVSATTLGQAHEQWSHPVPSSAGAVALDLFTDKGGLGANASGGLYHSNSRIILYANVTYNGEGVADILVAYEVRNALNHTIISSTTRSDLEGVARTNLTVPSAPPEEVFGTWTAFATASVAQKSASDRLTFEVIVDPPLLPGDANHDGRVDIRDAGLLGMAWRTKIGDANYDPNCDFNKDGEVNIQDAAILALHWGQTL